LSDPYVGEIRMFGGDYAPQGWAICDGKLLQISDYPELYNLLGTLYGGDGNTTFAVPDLCGRVPIHRGPGYATAQKGGLEQVTLTPSELPQHNHAPVQAAKTKAGASAPSGAFWAGSPSYQEYASAPDGSTVMAPGALTTAGSGQAHDNMSPFLAVNFIIAVFGHFPPS